MRRALRGGQEFGSTATTLVASDVDGRPVGAMTLVDHIGDVVDYGDGEEVEVPSYVTIDYVGTLGPGVGRDLVEKAKQHALDRKASLYAEPTETSLTYWADTVGMTEDPDGMGTGFLGFSYEELARELEAPNTGPEYPGDTPVSGAAAAALDKWVKLRGSGTLTDAERKTLRREIVTGGEKAPRLYRGANIDLDVAALKPGRAIDFGPSSTSEDAGSAWPYAENGDRTPVVFEIDGARGLNVQGRAEKEGFAEAEWVTAGRFYVTGVGEEDGVQVVSVSRDLPSGSAAQSQAKKPAIDMDARSPAAVDGKSVGPDAPGGAGPDEGSGAPSDSDVETPDARVKRWLSEDGFGDLADAATVGKREVGGVTVWEVSVPGQVDRYIAEVGGKQASKPEIDEAVAIEKAQRLAGAGILDTDFGPYDWENVDLDVPPTLIGGEDGVLRDPQGRAYGIAAKSGGAYLPMIGPMDKPHLLHMYGGAFMDRDEALKEMKRVLRKRGGLAGIFGGSRPVFPLPGGYLNGPEAMDRFDAEDREWTEWISADPKTPEALGWKAYTSYSNKHRKINRQLRGLPESGDTSRVPEWISQMDAMFARRAITMDVGVRTYRGAGPDGFDPTLKPGDEYVDPGFVSTTVDPKWAFGDVTSWHLVVDVPPGTAHAHGVSEQSEVLLNRDTRFRVLDVDPATKTAHVEVMDSGHTAPDPAITSSEGTTNDTVPEAGEADLAGPGGVPDPIPDLPGPVVGQSDPGDGGAGEALPGHVAPYVGPGDKVYRHPQGSYIVVSPEGAVAKIGPDGKPRKTSATAAKLAVGHGSWEPVGTSVPAPVKKPTEPPLQAKPIGDVPIEKSIVVSTKEEPELPSAPAPTTASKFQVPMTFNEASVADVPKFIEDPDYFFQQKIDGIRGQLVIEPGKKPWFRSKSGQALVNSSAAKITGPLLKKLGEQSDYDGPAYTIDGELLDGKWYVFDVAVDGGEKTPWENRMQTAEAWVGEMHKLGLKQIQALPTARTAEEKRKLWEAVHASGGEGVMMKRKDAPYNYGARVNHTLKAKITSTADVVVLERNIDGKENARIGIMINGHMTPIGTVSMQGKEKGGAVNVGDVIEVEYLWANKANHNLQQPRMKKKRPDKSASDATADQLRFVGKDVVDLESATVQPGASGPQSGIVSSGSTRHAARREGLRRIVHRG